MASKDEVGRFLMEFHAKKKVWEIFYRDDRGKNAQALADLEIRPIDRNKVIDGLIVEDYSQGPIKEMVFNGADMWVFGKTFKGKEIYIKITMGWKNGAVICISF